MTGITERRSAADEAVDLIDREAPLKTAQGVANRLGYHPVYLARCLAAEYGLATARYLRAFKVGLALAPLIAGDVKVSSIPALAGFGGKPLDTGQWRQSLAAGPASGAG